jgi:transcriptional regulator of NAD metabolism
VDATVRRMKILDLLKKSNEPLKGTELSKIFDVSRQVIVQDIALLRARGEDILATPQGYIIPRINKEKKLVKKIVSRHTHDYEIEDELTTIADLGGKIIDVIVEHPLYGEIRGSLEISSRLDVDEFMRNLKKAKAEPLSSLTGGIHIHTIEVKDEEAFERITEALKKKKYLISED